MLHVVVLGLLAVGSPLLAAVIQPQHSLQDVFQQSEESEYFQFKNKIERVAVIGAGVSGLVGTGVFQDHNLTVRTFERAPKPGGNWYYSEEVPAAANYDPSLPPSEADYKPVLPTSFPSTDFLRGSKTVEEEWRRHWLPRPLYYGLHNNNPISSHSIRELAWPPGTAWILPWKRIQQYVRAYASYRGLNVDDTDSPVSYGTRVELAERTRSGWTLTLRKIEPSADGKSAKVHWWQEEFDAVLVSTGRYNAPKVPDTKGLQAWARDPPKVIHSREYRHPEVYANETVLVVGASSSGIDISREIVPFAKTLFQSIRNSSSSLEYLKLFGGRLAPGAVPVPEVAEYLPNGASVRLLNGTVLHGIDRVVLATGYTRTFPFLPDVHQDRGDFVRHPIVTDGTHVQNLYLDTFYIPDPTLAFTNQNTRIAGPFRFAEYQAAAAAKAWTGHARLPSQSQQWATYAKQHKDQVPGKSFNDLNGDGTQGLIRRFVGWLNDEAVEFGGTQLDGYPPHVWEETKHFIGASGRGADYEVNPPTSKGEDASLLALHLADAQLEDGFGDW